MKYWHETPQDEIDRLIEDGALIQFVLDNYKQPDWCGYKQALSGMMGCWSLTDNEPGGLRTHISKEYCKGCDCFLTPNSQNP